MTKTYDVLGRFEPYGITVRLDTRGLGRVQEIVDTRCETETTERNRGV